MAREYIKQLSGRVLGYVEEDSSGNKIVYTLSGLIVSKYEKLRNITFDFYGRIIAFGDVASGALLVRNGITV